MLGKVCFSLLDQVCSVVDSSMEAPVVSGDLYHRRPIINISLFITIVSDVPRVGHNFPLSPASDGS